MREHGSAPRFQTEAGVNVGALQELLAEI